MSNANDGRVMRLVHRLSVKTYSDCINVLPHLAFDREPGCWGYPGCFWVAFGWLRWTAQVSLYTRPCEHCFGWNGQEKIVGVEP